MPERVRPFLLVVLVVLSTIGPLGAVQPARADSEDWVLVVLPYFLQDMDVFSGYNDNAAVFLYAYERVEAVVDLNHNGIADEDEPHIIVEKPGKRVYVGIGVSDLYNLYVEFRRDPGPLWLLVKPPVFVSYFVASEGEFLAGYTAPPPGTRIWVPPFPGYVYLAPADPRGANVTIEGGEHDGENYSLGPMDYLVLRAGNTSYTIRSDHPVAAVLVNLFPGGASSYMVQLVPLEERYEADAGIPLSTSTAPRPGQARVKTYYAAASTSGNASYGLLEAPANISDILGGPGVAYSLLTTNASGEVTAAAVAVYNVSAHPMLQDMKGLLTSLSLYGGTSDRSVTLYMSRLWNGSEGLLLADFGGISWSWTADIVFPLPMKWKDPVYTISARPGSNTNMIAYVKRFLSSRDLGLFYQLYESSSGDWGMARLLLVPVSLDSSSPIDEMLGSGVNETSWSFMYSIRPVDSHYDVRVMAHITPGENASCSQVTSYLVVMDGSLTPLAYSKDQYCDIWVETNLSLAPWQTVLGFHMGVVSNKTFLGGSFLRLAKDPGAQLFTPGPTPSLTVWSRDEGVHSPSQFPLYYLQGNYISRGLYHAPENLTQKIDELVEGLEPLPNKYRAPENQTGTQTPPETTQPSSATGQPGPTATTSTGANTTSWSGIPLKVGDTLTYKISLEAEGPNGTVRGSGEVTIKVTSHELAGGPVLELIRSNLPGDVKDTMILIAYVSDIFYIASTGISSSYNSSIRPTIDVGCPILRPGASGEHEGETSIYSLPGIAAKYKCTYSNGVLQHVVVDLSGEVQGQKISLHAEASLAGGTGGSGAHEGAAEGGAGSHLPLKILALVVVLIAVAIGLAVLARRK